MFGVVPCIIGRLDGEDASEKGLNYACNTLAIVSVRILCVPLIERPARNNGPFRAHNH
jgi:hypothetical protein